MRKTPIPITIVVKKDGLNVSKDNILNITAKYNEWQFSKNVLPQHTSNARETPYWRKHPVEFKALALDAAPLPEVISQFHKWLSLFNGNLISYSDPMDHSFLVHALLNNPPGRNPFGAFCIDVTMQSYVKIDGILVPRTQIFADPITHVNAREQNGITLIESLAHIPEEENSDTYNMGDVQLTWD